MRLVYLITAIIFAWIFGVRFDAGLMGLATDWRLWAAVGASIVLWSVVGPILGATMAARVEPSDKEAGGDERPPRDVEWEKAAELQLKFRGPLTAVCQSDLPTGREVTSAEITYKDGQFVISVVRTGANGDAISKDDHQFSSTKELAAWLEDNTVLRRHDFSYKS